MKTGLAEEILLDRRTLGRETALRYWADGPHYNK